MIQRFLSLIILVTRPVVTRLGLRGSLMLSYAFLVVAIVLSLSSTDVGGSIMDRTSHLRDFLSQLSSWGPLIDQGIGR